VENINDLIYAYSLGCLDPEYNQEFINLNDTEVDFKVLGEYQNLVSLLPIVLTIETPDPLVKDNVAKKLYSLTEQKKTVILSNTTQDTTSEENKTLVAGYTSSVKYPDNDEKELDDRVLDEKIPTDEINNNPLLEKNDTSSFEPNLNGLEMILPNDKLNLTGYRGYPSRYSDTLNKPTSKLIWGIILFGLLSIGLLIAYLNISSKTTDLNQEVAHLKREIFQLNLQLKSTQEMQDIVQSPNVFAINLTGSELNTSGFGKLFIDSVKGFGYIQLGQMSGITEGEAFQLWAKFLGKFISLGTFHVPDKVGYYSFNIKKMPYKEDISFFITKGSANGSISPEYKVYLQGSYNP
jgi:hypothetical protein